MTPNSFLPIFRIKGDNYEIGFEVGSNFKERIQQAFSKSALYNHLKEQDRLNPEWFNQLHEIAEKHYPQYLAEISGIADGADLTYRDVAIINFRGSFKAERVGCSTIIFNNQENIIVAHNEDHEAILGELAYLLMVKLNNGTSFIAYTYPGCLPGFSFSFNSHGLVQTANAMPDPVAKIGIPRHLLDRYMVEAPTIDDALQRAQINPRSGGFSYNIASMYEKKVVNIETTSEEAYITEISDRYVHTNHYISDKLKHIQIPVGSTEERYNRGQELLINADKSSNESLNILTDNKIYLPLRESTGLYGTMLGGTLCTAIFELENDIKLWIYQPSKGITASIQLSMHDLVYNK